jgi:hypothetical protein
MDEIMFQRAYSNLRTLIEHVSTEDGGHVRNALMTIAAMLDGLNQRITELQTMEGEDEE